MGDPSEFCLVVMNSDVRKGFKKFLDIAHEHGDVKKKPGKQYEIVLASMAYVLNQEKESTRFGNVKIRLHSLATLSEQEQITAFLDFCFNVCARMDPLYALGDNGITMYDFGPAWSAVEHYRNPYFFCLEPKKAEYGYDPGDDFVHDETLLNKISEIQKVISIDELVELLRMHCKKVTIGSNGGVSVLKGYGGTKESVALRYFLAKEIRRRGIYLEEGPAEQYAKELGIK